MGAQDVSHLTVSASIADAKDVVVRSLRFHVAHFVGTAVHRLLRLLRRNATQLPGFIALKIDKNYLSHFEIDGTVIAVTGTNGKTTTSNLLFDFLSDAGARVINNSLGSNTESGIASLLMRESKGRRVSADYLVLEIDERASIHIFKKLTPDYLVVTNIFRDSYSRNAHPDFILGILERAIGDSTVMVTNADDLLSSGIKAGNRHIRYSFAKEIEHSNYVSNVIDITNCPNCQHPLTVDYRRYHHIGRYHCEHCGFASPDADIELVDCDAQQVTISDHGETYKLPAISEREFDLYNQLAALTVLRALGFDVDKLRDGFAKLQVTSSRFSSEQIGPVQVITSVAKGLNPVATSRVFDYIVQQGKRCAIILVQSETGFLTTGDYDDSKNVTSESIGWLYEIDFELLTNPCVRYLVVGGKRILDVKVRCQLAGIDESIVHLSRNPLLCHEFIDLNEVDVIYILYDIHNKSFSSYNVEQIRKRLTQ